jgi:hypothetical protein
MSAKHIMLKADGAIRGNTGGVEGGGETPVNEFLD